MVSWKTSMRVAVERDKIREVERRRNGIAAIVRKRRKPDVVVSIKISDDDGIRRVEKIEDWVDVE